MTNVKTSDGIISGLTVSDAGQEMQAYRGIPYAAPPVGALRWKAPQPVTPWKGVRECVNYSIQPAQFPDRNVTGAERIPSSEDCLYLNVLTPAKSATEKLPVMVWFHGGGLRYGNGNWSLYNGPGLPRHGVVLVTVNGRLGVVGLMAHRLLSQESSQGVSGNYLFHDLIAALKWVQTNIAAFGGDPGNVTIFGESGGGMKVATLTASPLARGLFHRAICESGGSGMRAMTVKELEVFGEKLFAKMGVSKEKDPLVAARAVSTEKLLEMEQALNVELGDMYTFMGPWGPVVDGWFLPESGGEIFKAGKQNKVPLITVANLGELGGGGPVPGIRVGPAPGGPGGMMIPGYVNLLNGCTKAGVNGYAAIFDQVPSNWRQEGGVSAHGMEMHYVFGEIEDIRPWRVLRFLYSGRGKIKSPDPIITDADRRVSEAMMSMWAQFAKSGDPNVKGYAKWPVFGANDSYMYFADPPQVKAGYSKLP